MVKPLRPPLCSGTLRKRTDHAQRPPWNMIQRCYFSIRRSKSASGLCSAASTADHRRRNPYNLATWGAKFDLHIDQRIPDHLASRRRNICCWSLDLQRCLSGCWRTSENASRQRLQCQLTYASAKYACDIEVPFHRHNIDPGKPAAEVSQT